MKNICKNEILFLIIDNEVNAHFININQNTNAFNIFNKTNII